MALQYIQYGDSGLVYNVREISSSYLGHVFGAYSGIGIVGISQTSVRSRATLIPEWL